VAKNKLKKEIVMLKTKVIPLEFVVIEKEEETDEEEGE